MTNCEVELDLPWTKDCVLIEHHNSITGVNFIISSTKRYVPLDTFAINNNIKFLENAKQRFKLTISWSKYRSEITTQPKNDTLDCMVDPAFMNITRLFVFLL